jgi:hypothetical protein
MKTFSFLSEIYNKSNQVAQTEAQYLTAATTCKSLFEQKMKDYGCAWRILRPTSLTDQIFIKAQRIRTLQQLETKKVDEGEVPEFIGIVNYSIMALIQLELGAAEQPDLSSEEVMVHYNKHAAATKGLDGAKESRLWRGMARHARKLPNRFDSTEAVARKTN